jgi:hypothetical protein
MEGSSPKNNANKKSNFPSINNHQLSSSVKIPASAWKTLAILSCVATMVMYAETM